jgi:hypothetical protein
MPAPAGAELNCSRLDYGGTCVRAGCSVFDSGEGDEECCTKNGFPDAWDADARNACIEDDGDWVKIEDPRPMAVRHPEDCWGYIDVHWCVGPNPGGGGMPSWMQWISNPWGWVALIRFDCNQEPCWGKQCWRYECKYPSSSSNSTSYGSQSSHQRKLNIIRKKENTNEK